MMDYAAQVRQAKVSWKEKVEGVSFFSNFKHLQAINGWRPGELHTFIAGKGEGKSTLIRKWILEALTSKKRVYVRLSEEPAKDFMDNLMVFMGEKSSDRLEFLRVDSEMDFHDESLTNIDYKNIRKGYLDDLDYKLKDFGAELFIYDNFTTGILSRKKFLEEALAVELRNLAHINNIPVIVAAHTSKGFKKLTFATGDDIRGNMMLANTAAYVLTLTTFWDVVPPLPVVFWDKARHHSAANKKLFKLEYSKEYSIYIGDYSLPLESYHEIMAARFGKKRRGS